MYAGRIYRSIIVFGTGPAILNVEKQWGAWTTDFKIAGVFRAVEIDGVAKGKTERLKCSRIYQDCRAPTSVRINANLHSRGLPQLFRLKSPRQCASGSHGRLRPALR